MTARGGLGWGPEGWRRADVHRCILFAAVDVEGLREASLLSYSLLLKARNKKSADKGTI